MIDVPRYLHAFDARMLPQIFCDVLVIGAGVAGHAAILAAAEGGGRVLGLTKDSPLESNTLYAQAGIAAVLSSTDSIAEHIDDTIRAGDGLCDPDVVRVAVEAGPAAVRTLAERGVAFDREADGGEFSLGREGGHSHRRVAHAHGDATGREFQRALSAAVGKLMNVRMVSGAFAVDLLTAGDECVGALVRYGGELRVVRASGVVLATGGAGRLFRETTNPMVTTGDGLAMAYRAGAVLRDMEFMQFHPTVLYVPGAERALISEAARGEGAIIRDVRGERFLESYDPRAELAPRDVVSRAIVSHIVAHDDTHVLLDLTGIDEERLRRRLPGVLATGASIGIDPTKEPLPVRPAAHYTVGGVVTDLDGRTTIKGLFAAGEVTSSGLHGANRLASNSLLEGAVFGRAAGRAAAAEARGAPAEAVRALDIRAEAGSPSALDHGDVVRSVQSLLWHRAGVRRTGEGLANALTQLQNWSRLVLPYATRDDAGGEAQNLCTLAVLLVEAARLREETRGVHWRMDFPEHDDVRFLGHVTHRIGQAPRLTPLPVPDPSASAGDSAS